MIENLKDLATDEMIVGSTLLGGGGLWLFFKRFLVKNATENTNLSVTDAYSEIINNLREEVRRLSETNAKLALALNELQAEEINLKREISQLHESLNSMHERLAAIQFRSTDIPNLPIEERRKQS